MEMNRFFRPIVYFVIFNHLMLTAGMPAYAAITAFDSLDQQVLELRKGDIGSASVTLEGAPSLPALPDAKADSSAQPTGKTVKIYSETETEPAKKGDDWFLSPQFALPAKTDKKGPAEPSHSGKIPVDNALSGIVSSLPSLGEKQADTPAEPAPAPDASIAKEDPRMPPSLTGIRSLWQVLGADSRAQAGINMISGIGSGLADNALRDWLGQSSNSKFQFSSNGTGSADILLPLWEGTNNLLFSQIGIRRNSERTTYNVGSGLRHFIDDGWMLGINGFWDYDLTGDNARFGLGVEGWTDYLKLSANGYFRLTQWHQSPLGVMEDYDERPANGFDVNAQAWLPAYPQLGGALKYEKYFGKGVILNDSASVSALKDSPSAVTTEINYTPFPLLTLSAGHRAGTISENYANIAVSYRTGVSWRDQIDPRTVGIMRSLAGSRYDFVDRNYNIVMQYRKQDLIALSLPASVTGEAMTTLSIDASVRAKYGLKDIHWEAPELISAGGKIQKTSPTSLSVTLPAYSGEGNNGWRVTAVATDTHGNAAPQQETLINVIRSSNTIHLTQMPAGSIVANGIDEGKATALLTDKAGAPLSNMTVKFTLSGPSKQCIINDAATCEATLSSNSAGEVSIRFRGTTAGNYQLLAAMENGNSDSKTVSFIGDVTTAKIDSLTVVNDNAVADGVAAGILRVTVVDAYNNRLADQPVALRADMRLVLPAKSVTTGSEGTADIAVTSTTATSADVTATLGTSTANATLTFIADRSTAQINTLQVVNNNALANGFATGSLRVIVHDAHGNSVAGQEVTLQAAKGLKLTSASVTTGIDGSAIITATSRVATTMSVTASIGASSASADLTFMADSSTAQVSALTVLNDNAIADGVDTVDLQVSVTDAWGNALADQVVTPDAVNDLTLSATRVITGSDGLATFSVTSQVAAASHVSASLGGTSAQATVHFIADARTARIDSLEVLTNNSVADGNIRNALRVIVNDANGNRLAGQKVDLRSDKRLTLGADSVITGSEGSAIITATSLTAATYEITASLADSTANASITFIADTRTAKISKLSVSTDNAVANGTATNTLQVWVNDAKGNALANMKVQLTAENGVILSNRVVTTDVDGRATFTATSRIASAFTITASLGESSENARTTVHFVADSSTARVTALTVTADNVVADGVAKAALRVTVQDKNGNPVPNQSVVLSAETGLVLQASGITTGSDGTATFTATSTVAAGLNVTASVGESNLSARVNFIADATSAEITALAVTTDNVVANGAAKAALKVTVKDKNGNPLAGQKVSLNADKTLTLSAATVITGSDGTTTFTATSTTATTSNIRATLGESVRNASVTFIGDVTTAQITALMVTTDNVVADGAAKVALRITVQDKSGNLLAGQKISLSADKALTLSAATITTAKDGNATFTATSTTAATFPVRAALGDSVRNANVSFIGDVTTAQVSALKVTTDNVVANGTAKAALRVTVQDKHGNLLADQKVALTAADKGVTLSAASVTTAKDGTATFTATSTTAAVYSVSAGLGDSSQSARVTFIADVSTARVSNLTVTTDNVVANGMAKAALRVTVQDQHGNLLAGQKVALSAADKGVTLSAASVTTAKDGTATFTATSTTAAAYSINAGLGESSKTATVTFIGDVTTAQVSDLTVTTDNVVANGTARAALRVTVRDQHGNPLADQKVTLTAADKGVTLSTASVTTAEDGTVAFTATSTTAATYSVSAGLDKSSKTATVTFIADATTAQVSALTVTNDNVVANGSARAALRVTVQDQHGNPLADQKVTLTAADKGVTLSAASVTTAKDGTATFTATSTTAAAYAVSATLGNSSKTTTVTFIGDVTTAQVSDLTVTTDNVVANGTAKAALRVTVQDQHGNPLAAQKVTLIAKDNGVTLSAASVTTAKDGTATFTAISTTAAAYSISAGLDKSSKNATVTFIADATTAQVSDLTVTTDNVVANGTAKADLRVTVQDQHGNPLTGQKVTLTAKDNGITLSAASVTTAKDGTATFTATSTLAVAQEVSATLGKSSKNATVTFVADATTAQVSALTVATDNVLANGTAKAALRVTVQDQHGNPLAGQPVALSTGDKGITLSAASVTTAKDGTATFTATSTTAAAYSVSAGLGKSSKTATVTFIADATTAQVSDLTVTTDNVAANGSARAALRVTVRDQHGNPLFGQKVTLTAADKGVTLSTASVTTAKDGTATFAATSTTAAAYAVSATLGNTSKTTTVTFIADATTAQVSTLTVTTDNVAANGTAKAALRVTVQDQHGNPLAAQKVTLSAADKGVTLSAASVTTAKDGTATFTATSTTAAAYSVRAGLGESSKTTTVTFIGDVTTAQVSDLTVTTDNVAANGTAKAALRVTVQDQHGNPLADQKVTLTAADKGVTLSAASVTTAKDGTTTFTATSTTAAAYSISAGLDKSSKNATVTFIADASTAQVSDLTVTTDNVAANGTAKATLRVTVQDEHGNPLAGQKVTLSAKDNGITLSAASITTAKDGTATFTATSTTAAAYSISATLGKSSKTTTVTFVADATTAQVSALTVTTDNVLANGKAKAELRVTVRDQHGNPLDGQKVTLSGEDKGITLSAASVTTAKDGTATFTATSMLAVAQEVSATLGKSSRSTMVTFIADASTARVSALTVTTDNVVANGEAPADLRVTVQDEHGNPLADQKVTLTHDQGLTLSADTVTTAKDGTASFTATSTIATIYSVGAILGKSSKNATVTFIADASTARVSALTVITDNALANGTARAQLSVTVQDKYSNPLADQTVALTAGIGATLRAGDVVLNTDTVTTAKDGTATFTATSSTAAAYEVRATLGKSFRNARVTFIADATTAQVSGLTVTTDNVLADGTAKAALSVTIKDKTGNLVPNQKVTLTTKDKSLTLSTDTVITGKDGTATFTATSTLAVAQEVSATLGKSSRSTMVTFISDATTAQVSALTVTTDNVVANGTAQAALRVTVEDQHGNPLSGQKVTLSAKDNGITLSAAGVTTAKDGTATFTATSTIAAALEISATLGKSSKTATVTYTGDASTAQVSDLTVITDNAVANGKDKAVVRVTVQDQHGNPLADQTVALTADKGMVLSAPAVTTAKDGTATFTTTSTFAVAHQVSATFGKSSKTASVTFIGDASTAQISDLTVVTDNVLANGTAKAALRVTVQDEHGNLLASQKVALSAENNGVKLSTASVTTAKDGTATFTATSTIAAAYKVRAALGESFGEATVTFIPDASTAQVSALTVTTDNVLADGKAMGGLLVTVEDKNGNRLAGQEVTLSTEDKGVTLSAATVTTEKDGTVAFTATSTTAAIYSVKATLGKSSRSTTVTFIADASTARVSALTVTTDSVLADGKAMAALMVTVADKNGNLLADQTVNLTADKGVALSAPAVTTGKDGTVTFTATSTLAAGQKVSAKLGESTADAMVTFIADSNTAQIGSLVVTGDNAVANDKTTDTLVVTVRDAHGNPVGGQAVTLSSESKVTLQRARETDTRLKVGLIVYTDEEGKAPFNATSTTAGTWDVTATLGKSVAQAKVTFIAGEISNKSSFYSEVPVTVGNGNGTISLVLKAFDIYNNAVTGKKIVFKSKDMNNITFSDVSEKEGVYTVQIASAKPGRDVISVWLDGVAIGEINPVNIGFYRADFVMNIN